MLRPKDYTRGDILLALRIPDDMSLPLKVMARVVGSATSPAAGYGIVQSSSSRDRGVAGRAMWATDSAIRRPLRSALLLLVFWNALFLAILLLLYDINIDFKTAGIQRYVDAVFGITHYPVGFQFRFVRDLFVTALVSPLLSLALRHAPLAGAVVLGAVWITDHDLWIFFRTDVLFFFYLGGLVRMRSALERDHLRSGHIRHG
jgi:hypothetical protein